jgi:Tol biopolymer transport system component
MKPSRSTLLALALFVVGTSAHAQGVTEIESVDSSGTEGNDDSGADWIRGYMGVAISADGRFVAFSSSASNLVAGDTNGTWDVFVRDRVAGTTERVSVDSAGAESDGQSWWPALSGDGRLVVFMSQATNLVAGDVNGHTDVFVRDRTTGTTSCASVDPSGNVSDQGAVFPSISADGSIVAFSSTSTNLVAGDANGKSDTFARDLAAGTMEIVSVDSAGAQADGHSQYAPALSSDGRFVAFTSDATNLVPGDTNGYTDVFVRDRSGGTTERVSVDSNGAEGSGTVYGSPSISSDGTVVAFTSGSTNLVPNDNNKAWDVFVHDRTSGATERVSVDSSGAEGNGSSVEPAISADGQTVAFSSNAANFVAGDRNFRSDIFVHDRRAGFTACMSLTPAGTTGNDASVETGISGDGQMVVFASAAPDLVPGDSYGWDVFVHERCLAPAAWSNYGAGFPGTNGVPAFTARSFPAIGTTVTLDVANSYGSFTAGVLVLGQQRASIPSAWGGDLLVAPTLVSVFGMAPSGLSIGGTLPRDDALCGTTYDLQALELDPGAAKGVSFTPGIELVIGH